MFDDTKPIFLQLAERIANDILRGTFEAGEQVPSTNELAAHLRINPATAGKALGVLVDRGILVKQRGIGMFVAEGAQAKLADERTQSFVRDFIRPLLAEAQALSLGQNDLHGLIAAELAASQAQASAPQPVPNSAPAHTPHPH